MAVVMDAKFRMPAEVEEYLQESIYHMVGFCSGEERMKQRVEEAEEQQRKLSVQVRQMQQRMREVEFKCAKSKEEAALNAQALRRQVAECQKLSEQCSRLREECSRLESECQLFHNDREVFMEAADEAEERAAEAEERAGSLAAEVERLKRVVAHKEREMDKGRLQAELECAQEQVTRLGKEKGELLALLATANERYGEFLRELTAAQDGSGVLREVGIPANIFLPPSGAAACKAMEQENKAAASDCRFLVKSMKKELHKSRSKVLALMDKVEEVTAALAMVEHSSRAQAKVQQEEIRILTLLLSSSKGLDPPASATPRPVHGCHRCMQRL